MQGLVAIAAGTAKSVLALDVNPRCVHFTRVNATLNGLEHLVEVRASDIFSGALEDELFDAIYVNPPFVPSPFGPSMLQATTYRDGGPDGTAVLRKVLQGAAARLRIGGFLLAVAELCNVDRCEWLQETAAAQHGASLCGFHVFHNPAQRWSLDEYVKECCTEHPNGPGPEAWTNVLRSVGVADVGAVFVCARRTNEFSDLCSARSVCLVALDGDGDDFLGVEHDTGALRHMVLEALRVPRTPDHCIQQCGHLKESQTSQESSWAPGLALDVNSSAFSGPVEKRLRLTTH